VPTLVLLRHGESAWNASDTFTGWTDIDLTPRGEEQARAAGRALRRAGVVPTVVHTSVLIRAIRTAELALAELGLRAGAGTGGVPGVPIRQSWRLNERHYGDLQGRNKAETRRIYGEPQFLAWRRSYSVPPPPLPEGDPRSARCDPRYAGLDPALIPATESLADVVARLVPYWREAIAPDLAAGRVVLVSAHGNSLRALRKHLEGINDEDIVDLELPTGIPTVMELDDGLAVLSKRDLPI